jgi:hypothetical protein
MKGLTMESLVAGDLTINVVDEDTTMRLHWLGMSNDRQPEAILKPFFTTVMQHAIESKKSLALHFEKIDRFNSSTILSIIKVIQEARHKSVRLEVVYDPTRKWQRLSFDALRIFDRSDALFALRAMETA